MGGAETIAKAQAAFVQAQDAALASGPLAQMAGWIARGDPPPAAELRAFDLDGVERGDNALFLTRNAFHRHWGFSIPCQEAVAGLVGCGPLVEVGAGSGYWSALLQQAGADIVATDPTPTGNVGYGFAAGVRFQVLPLDAMAAATRFADRAVFCSWPTRDAP